MTRFTNLPPTPAHTGPVEVTAISLRDWPLPKPEESRDARGRAVIVGGARRSPGAAMLAGVAALRVGAGRLTLVVADSVAVGVAVAIPEGGIVGLAETSSGHLRGTSIQRAKATLADADAVLVGPGLDSAVETAALLDRLSRFVSDRAVVVLDAFAIGVLPAIPSVVTGLAGRLVLTPTVSEASRLLGRDYTDRVADVCEIAERYSAVVSCQGVVANTGGDCWRITPGNPGLGTSASGDVLGGVLVGLAARGATLSQAAVWATHLHAVAGDRLAARISPLGFLARELLDELPLAMREVEA